MSDPKKPRTVEINVDELKPLPFELTPEQLSSISGGMPAEGDGWKSSSHTIVIGKGGDTDVDF